MTLCQRKRNVWGAVKSRQRVIFGALMNSQLHPFPPQLVVFDLAGVVLGQSEGLLNSFVVAMQAHGVVVEPEVASVAMGYPAMVGIERMLAWLRPEATAGGALHEQVFQSFLKQHIRYCRYTDRMEWVPGLLTTCAALRKCGVRIAMATSLEDEVVELLNDRLQWRQSGLFDLWQSGTRVADVRPGPGLIRDLMARADVVNPAAVVKVGDTPVDMEEGHHAGCGWTMLLDSGWLDGLAIASARPDAILEYVDDLLAYLPIRLPHGVRP